MTDVPETLDPDDWQDARALAHQMVDTMIDYLQGVADRPAWQSVPETVRRALDEPLPRRGAPLAQVFEQFREQVLPYPTGNLHPGFFGWVMGNGTVTGMLADMLASGMNPHLAGYDQSAAFVERTVIGWLGQLVGFPADCSGLLVTGGTMANLNGLAVARQAKAGFDVRDQGLRGDGAAQLTVYGSAETHSWVYKACEVMGLGRRAFRQIEVDEGYRINLEACRSRIEQDLAAGLRPFCLIGTAGTVNTGAIDDLAGLRALADEFGLWLHIDGAFGSLAAWSPATRPLVAAQRMADSIAFDLHKWGYMPYDVGCVLTRHRDAQTETFGQDASYLTSPDRGPAVGTTYFADRGLQLSRSFRALKVWMSLKEHGADKIGRIIARNIEQARHFAGLVDAEPRLQRMAPVPLNIVCYRFMDERLDAERLDALNQELLLRIQEKGDAIPSHTRLRDRFAIRVSITNHRTRPEDLDRLLADSIHMGSQIAAEMAGG